MQANEQEQSQTQLTRLPVLVIVDDDEALATSLRGVFRHCGYSTYAFTSAASALEFISRAPADLVIADLRMPVMTGIELLQQISTVSPDAIRMILGGSDDRDAMANAQSRGLAHNMVVKPWNDVLVRELIQQALDQKEGIRRQHLKEILGSIDALPSPPSFHVKLQAELAREGSSIYDIAREIEKSPPIVAKLLRVANSVYFARRKPFVTVHDAVFFIGTDYIAGLVAAIEAFHGFALQARPELSAQIERLWVESFRRATLAKKIAEKWPGLETPEAVYIASLLQDIGYAVTLCFDPEMFAEYVRQCEQGILSPYDVEVRLFDHMHDTMGAALLEYWKLSPTVVKAVEKHHQRTDGDPLLQILQIADSLWPGMRSLEHDPAVDELIVLWRARMANELEVLQKMPSGQ